MKKELPIFNACPTDLLPIIRNDDKEHFTMTKWDFGNQSAFHRGPLKNATIEKILTLKSFKEAIQTRRCLVPADGYYEWKVLSAKEKLPYHIHHPDYKLFAFPGIYTTIKWGEGELTTFAIITQEPHSNIAEIHDRMPAFLLPEHEKVWLDQSLTGEEALEILQAYPKNTLVANPVSKHVNKVRESDPDMIKPIGSIEFPRQQDLF